MKNDSTRHVGLDVHKESIVVGYASSDGGGPGAPRRHRHASVRHRRRGYWLRLLHGSVSYDHVTPSRSGPGPPTPNARGLDTGSQINAAVHLRRTERPKGARASVR